MSSSPSPDSTPIANAGDHDFKGARTALYLFQFGAYGTTFVYAWGCHTLDDALEAAAEWLKENEPGHFVTFSEADYEEAARDIGAPADWRDSEASGPGGDQWRYAVAQRAEVDHTYTESGYLASWEWYVNEIHDVDEVATVRYRSRYECGIGEDEGDDDSGDRDGDDSMGDRGRTMSSLWWTEDNGYLAAHTSIFGSYDYDTGRADLSGDCQSIGPDSE